MRVILFAAFNLGQFWVSLRIFSCTLALVAKYARENISKEVENGGNWSPEETFNFGEYVISILALTGKTHFTLKNMADAYQRSTLIEDIKTGEAKSFLCHFYDEIKITDLVLSYFKSGYLAVIVKPLNYSKYFQKKSHVWWKTINNM